MFTLESRLAGRLYCTSQLLASTTYSPFSLFSLVADNTIGNKGSLGIRLNSEKVEKVKETAIKNRVKFCGGKKALKKYG